ncbi:MAG TPA: hypothetical protein VGK52_03200 [Polyangia bacterium]
MPGPDPSHWLHRLTPAEWLAAAETELERGAEALARRAMRPGVTHARRAAGMAWNAVLAAAPDAPTGDALVARFGRSYMEHVAALASATDTPAEVRAAAALLRDTPPAPPALITLGKPDLRALEAARAIVAHARGRL